MKIQEALVADDRDWQDDPDGSGAAWRGLISMETPQRLDTGRRRHPPAVFVVGAAYLLAAVATAFEINRHYETFYAHQYLFMLLYPVIAYGVLRVQRWAWILLVTHLVFLLIANGVLLFAFGELTHVVGFEFLLLGAFLFYLTRSNVRWVRLSQRYSAPFAATLRRGEGEPITAKGVNISVSGCLVELSSDQSVDLNEQLEVEVTHGTSEAPHITGLVVRVDRPTGDHPRTAAIEFTRRDRTGRRQLRAIIRGMKSR